MDSQLPLAVDLDGTLLKSDSLIDALTSVSLRSPKHIPALIRALHSGRFSLKAALTDVGGYRPDVSPLRDELVAYLRQQKSAGRSLHLVTASPQVVADAVAARLDLFETVAGSKDGVNLKGAAKVRYLQEKFPKGFAYAGNDTSDLEVWRHSASAVPVAAPAHVERAVAKLGVPIEERFPRQKTSVQTWLRMLRIHQWSKNLLLFVPLILAHEYGNLIAIMHVCLAFFCMGLVASATYILNDLSDLDADRRHATKRYRPLAAAEISAISGMIAATVLGVLGILGAVLVDPLFAVCLVFYIVLTLAYSLRLKAIPLLDVFVLGLLYTLRIIMGIVLLHVAASPWLLMFSLFFFLSLSLAKRHVEIVRAAEAGDAGRIRGRGYRTSDAPLTLALGISSSSISVVLLFLYVANSAYPIGAYGSPQWLWAISPLVFLWMTRIWLKSHRAKLDDDPINFALRDPPSLLLGGLVALTFALAVL